MNPIIVVQAGGVGERPGRGLWPAQPRPGITGTLQGPKGEIHRTANHKQRFAGNRKVAGSIPGLLPLLAKCGGVPEQDAT